MVAKPTLRIFHKAIVGCFAAVVLTLAAALAEAGELRIALAEEPSSIDPHYHDSAANNIVRRHLFDSLVMTDAALRLLPGLATSWRSLDQDTWEFKLRQGVTFHDGTPFTAADVAYTIERIPSLAGGSASFAAYTTRITEVKTPDAHTVIFKTARPTPLLPVYLAQFGIMSRMAAEGLTSEQLNQGEGVVGTGPYKFLQWDKGDRLILEANDAYWRGREPWDRVILGFLPDPAVRVEALNGGQADVIEEPPPETLRKLMDSEDTTLAFGLSSRLIYLQFDHEQEPTPGVDDAGGKNPFKDRRVREAMSRAIDRRTLVEEALLGLGMPATQLIPPGMFGYDGLLLLEPFDPIGARALLEAAGYPEGFSLTLAAPNDRYAFDAAVAEAVAEMLRAIGLKVTVEAMSRSEFFTRRNKYEFSFYLGGFDTNLGEASQALINLLATRDSERGLGRSNRGRYSEPQLDRLLDDALATIDESPRARLLAEAGRLAMTDYALLPLYYEVAAWGLRRSVRMRPRADRQTTAMSVRPVLNQQ